MINEFVKLVLEQNEDNIDDLFELIVNKFDFKYDDDLPYVIEIEALNDDDYDIADSKPITNVCIIAGGIEIVNATKIQTLLKNDYLMYDTLIAIDDNEYDGMRDAARIHTVDTNKLKLYVKIARTTDEFVTLITRTAKQLSF